MDKSWLVPSFKRDLTVVSGRDWSLVSSAVPGVAPQRDRAGERAVRAGVPGESLQSGWNIVSKLKSRLSEIK